MSEHSTATHQAHEQHHHGGPKLYLAVLLALLFLTVVTVGASMVDFGSPTVNVVIALAIATLKAALVALFFMHLAFDKPINSLILLAGLLFLGVFLGFCLIDVEARDPLWPKNWKPVQEMPVAPSEGVAPAGGGAATAPTAATQE
ncbi:MAG: cytochrome C oxidase subunit IV family protein [Bryobacteraceae bacterium]